MQFVIVLINEHDDDDWCYIADTEQRYFTYCKQAKE